MRYCSCHENIKFISSRHRVIFFLLYGKQFSEFYSMHMANYHGIDPFLSVFFSLSGNRVFSREITAAISLNKGTTAMLVF